MVSKWGNILLVVAVVLAFLLVGNICSDAQTYKKHKIVLKDMKPQKVRVFLAPTLIGIKGKSRKFKQDIQIPYADIEEIFYSRTSWKDRRLVLRRRNDTDVTLILDKESDLQLAFDLSSRSGVKLTFERNRDGIVPRFPPPKDIKKETLIKHYLSDRVLDPIEGIWVRDNSSNEVAIIGNESLTEWSYVGYDLGFGKRGSSWHKNYRFFLKKTSSKDILAGQYVTKNMWGGERYEFWGTTLQISDRNLVEFTLPSGPYGSRESHMLIRTYPLGQEENAKSGNQESTVQSGTGFFIADDIIATNYHVVADVESIFIHWKETQVPAYLLIRDKVNDLALLRVEFESGTAMRGNPLTVGRTSEVEEGDQVYTVGFPLVDELGRRARVSEGIINSEVGFEDDPRMMQISVPVQPGNSGGPLFSIYGEVVGVVTSTMNNAFLLVNKGTLSQNVNFAIKANYLNNLVALLPTDLKLRELTERVELNATGIMEMSKDAVVLVIGKR